MPRSKTRYYSKKKRNDKKNVHTAQQSTLLHAITWDKKHHVIPRSKTHHTRPKTTKEGPFLTVGSERHRHASYPSRTEINIPHYSTSNSFFPETCRFFPQGIHENAPRLLLPEKRWQQGIIPVVAAGYHTCGGRRFLSPTPLGPAGGRAPP